jgi:hypothetical protein
MYPRGLLWLFAIALCMFAAAAAFGLAALASSHGEWVDAALLALAVGGALGYGCVARAEEIDEQEALSGH